MGDWPVGYLHNLVEELNSGLPRTNPDSGRLEDLNQGPPDFKSSTLNHLATVPLFCEFILSKWSFRYLELMWKSCWHLPPLCVSHTCRCLKRKELFCSLKPRSSVLPFFARWLYCKSVIYKNAPRLTNIGNGISTLVFQVLASYRWCFEKSSIWS